MRRRRGLMLILRMRCSTMLRFVWVGMEREDRALEWVGTDDEMVEDLGVLRR